MDCVGECDYAKIRMFMERLLLFDIDGTLTRTQNGYIPFNEAIRRSFGIDGDIRAVIPDGNTDPLIVADIFLKANAQMEIDASGWSRFSQTLSECFREAILEGKTAIRPLPGALELIRALAESDCFYPSVVTGNFEGTAKIKLESAGLLPYFHRGAYASDSDNRSDLPQIAKQRWEEQSGRTIDAHQCVVIGDTPKDLAAARHNQMKCVLVGTGRYPIEELRYAEPDECVADLVDTEFILQMLAKI